MNRDSFFKSQNESRIDTSRKFENRAYPRLPCLLSQLVNQLIILLVNQLIIRPLGNGQIIVLRL